ncbi:MAG: flippase-like domain-containing protein, partial [Candidatus Aminicenantales bacterium]
FSKLGMTLLFGIEAGRAAGVTLVFHALQIAVTCALGYAILAHEGLTLIQLKRMGEGEKR